MARKPAQRKPARAAARPAAAAKATVPDGAAKGQTVRGGGRNISVDEQGRTIYYNGLLKKSFVLKPSDQRIYTNLSARYFIALAVGVIVWGLSRSIPWGVGLGLLAAVILTAWFYYGFLTKLDVAENVPRPMAQQTPFSFAMKTASLERTVMFAVIGIVLGILLILNIQQQGFEGTTLTLNWVLAIGAFVFGAYQLLVLIVGLVHMRDRS